RSISPPDESEEESDRQPWQGGRLLSFFGKTVALGDFQRLQSVTSDFLVRRRNFLVCGRIRRRGADVFKIAQIGQAGTMNGSPETTADDMQEGFCDNIKPFPMFTQTPCSVHCTKCIFQENRLWIYASRCPVMARDPEKFAVYVSTSL